MTYSLLLSDELCALFYDFKSGKDVNKQDIENLLSMYEKEFLLLPEQAKKHLNNELSQYLSRHDGDGEDYYLNKTKYKIKLTNDDTENKPYIFNIKDKGQLVRQYGFSFNNMNQMSNDKQKTIGYILHLVKNAKNCIEIIDNYLFTPTNQQDTLKFFENMRKQNNSIKIYYYNKNVNQNILSQLKKLNITQSTRNNPNHDRYIKIDNITIMLSSGLDNLLQDNTKELNITIN